MGISHKSKFIGFLDESGDHSLKVIDKDFPIFLLCLLVAERDNYRDRIIPEITRFKLKYWDHEAVNLHSSDIRKAQGDFNILMNRFVRERFLSELNNLMENLPYTVFISAVRKGKHLKRYGEKAKSPYELSLTFIMERVLDFMEINQETELPLIAESRGKNEDVALERFFYKLMTTGTYYNPPERFKRLSTEIIFKKKSDNITGIQLADLCAHPCARHIIKPEQKNRAHEIVKRHIYVNGNIKGWKIFPKK